MFDEISLKKIDAKYFNIILLDNKDITLQSRNTGHYWYLHCTEYPEEQSLIIFHKHFFKCPYHQHGKRNVKPEMAELKGKRLIISSEMEEGMRLNTAVVKQLCSTDEIQAEKKYKDPFSFVPSHTLVLYTNHLPKVGANDDGIWRRLIVIPFNAKITGKSDIKNYADYLFEHAGPAIMNWIIEGAKKAIDKDFHTDLPDVVEAAIKAYREDNDWLGQFLEECCEMDPSYKEKSGELYQTYRAHCMQNGEYIRSTTDFYSSMDKAGFNRIRKNTGVQVVGLKLKEGQDFLN